MNGWQLWRPNASRSLLYKARSRHPQHQWAAERQDDDTWHVYVNRNAAVDDDPWATQPLGPARDRRLPVEPLLRHARVGAGARGLDYGTPATEAAIAEWLGCERAQFYRWKADGIPMMSADKYARELGLHVLNIWPDAYDDIPLEDAAA